ncbi:Protein of uncharacterised function (DUF2562) [Mycolicibacterium phlei]|nr:cell wall synthesis protein CwsA [Mycolicibacterium phlei]AMO58858.1 Cell wall synthesis protein CwsA [Mycolicibacterium phlei]KXW74959.1 hypothetical protein JL15_25080 [Mycolicibacterium phlei DSM 43071]STZ14981.1 Protein of uncharacterised function (DUF2562) [Mycolicibacterium phlei]VEG06990.1 Protein of uncharacterised function (DUF2562) [Mycobacteroides chelonae]
MSSSIDTRLTPGQRLGRGVKYTAAGPVYLAQGLLGVGLSGVRSTAAWAGERYRQRRELSERLEAAQEAAQEAVANLPEALEKVRTRGRRRPLLLAAAGAAVLAAGGLAFFLIRRSSRPEEPPVRPPSVEVSPQP